MGMEMIFFQKMIFTFMMQIASFIPISMGKHELDRKYERNFINVYLNTNKTQ